MVLSVSRGFSADESDAWNNAMLYLGSIVLGMAVILATFFLRQREFKRELSKPEQKKEDGEGRI